MISAGKDPAGCRRPPERMGPDAAGPAPGRTTRAIPSGRRTPLDRRTRWVECPGRAAASSGRAQGDVPHAGHHRRRRQLPVGPRADGRSLGTRRCRGAHSCSRTSTPRRCPRWRRWPHKLNEAMGAKATVATTTDQRPALDGADFVIVCISTGGFRSMAVDLDVPARHGITPDGGRHRRARWHQPVPAQHPGAGRHRQGHGGALPRRLAVQHHQPDDLPDPLGLPGDRASRPSASATRSGNFSMDLAIALGRPFEAVTAVGDRGQPLPGAHLARGRRRRRLRHPAETGRRGRRAGRRWPPTPGRPEAEKFSKLDFAQRHLLKLTLLDRWGTFPAAGDRHIAEFVLVRAHARVRVGRRLQHRAEPDRAAARSTRPSTSPTSTPGWPAPRTCRPGSRASCPSPMIEAMLTGEPLRGAGQHPQRRPGARPAGRRGGRVDLRDRRRRHPRPRRRPRCPPPTTRSCGATWPRRSSPSRRPSRATARLAGEAFALDPLAGRGDLAPDRGHGRRAARRHGGVAAAVR